MVTRVSPGFYAAEAVIAQRVEMIWPRALTQAGDV